MVKNEKFQLPQLGKTEGSLPTHQRSKQINGVEIWFL
jgi:hypothetical protein